MAGHSLDGTDEPPSGRIRENPGANHQQENVEQIREVSHAERLYSQSCTDARMPG
jgi:hypothetical protein